MTDRNDAVRQVEEWLGSEGTHEMAEAVFTILRESGFVTFDPQCGFEFANVPEGAEWNAILAEALEATP